MGPPPSTPTPRRFLLSKRSTQTAQTPAQHPQFQSTPRFGSSSVPRPTQRGYGVEAVDDEHDESQDSLPRDEAVRNDTREQHDSIEIESDAVSESQHDEASPLESASIFNARDDIVADSLEADHARYDGWSPEGRDAKRRKFSVSPEPGSETPTGRLGDADSISGHDDIAREYSEDTGSLIGDDSDGHSPAEVAAARATQQPVFQPAPRFKPVEIDEAVEGLPAAFSPQRRGAKYLPDGLAAELQGWLSEVKGWEGIEAAADSTLRITIDEIRPGRQMYLVKARSRPGEGSQNFILAGEGKLTGLGQRAAVAVGSVVTVGQPVWDVELEGQRWTVACDWTVT